jgi:hypothetical protein
MDSEILKQISLADGAIVTVVGIVVYAAWHMLKGRLDEIILSNETLQEQLQNEIVSVKDDIDEMKKEYMSNEQLTKYLELLIDPISQQINKEVAAVKELLKIQVDNLQEAIKRLDARKS